MLTTLHARSLKAAFLVTISATAFAGPAQAGSNVWRGPLYFYDQFHGRDAPTGSVTPPAEKAAPSLSKRKPLSPKGRAQRSSP